MKLMKTEDAVGHVLCHDITQIIRDEKKGPVFRKGHIIRLEDVPVLLSVGKDNIYIWENNENMLHEDEAAEILRDICINEHMHATEPKEGKIELIADTDGLLLIDIDRLRAVNSLPEMMIATRASGFVVKEGEKLCGTRVIPLIIEKEKMERAKDVAGSEPLLRLVPLKSKKVGVVTTGNEVFYGRIQDTFTPVIEQKLREFGGCVITEHVTLNDDHEKITTAILDMLDKGCEMVLCSGGMSVDPDDKTPLAIKNSGADIVSYGSPVLPGAMFLVSYMPDGRPVCGLPGCVMYAKRTIFDLLLPYLVTDTPITKEHLAALGHGGLCLNCKVCHFPNCGFGKGT
ncbi:MAG: molybdopterin-binding protein [Oscillospiraceae bacterium]|nr:molybdopterin-binding protein [Oscillospiraceae bacterium]